MADSAAPSTKTRGRGSRRTLAVAFVAALLVGMGLAALSDLARGPSQATLTVAIAVRSEPPGAEVMIDGKPAGTTPLRSLSVSHGPHKIVLSKKGYEPRRMDVSAIADGEVFSAALVRLANAGLSVSSVPSGATVYLDGLAQGATPLRLEGLEPGECQVRVVLPVD